MSYNWKHNFLSRNIFLCNGNSFLKLFHPFVISTSNIRVHGSTNSYEKSLKILTYTSYFLFKGINSSWQNCEICDCPSFINVCVCYGWLCVNSTVKWQQERNLNLNCDLKPTHLSLEYFCSNIKRKFSVLFKWKFTQHMFIQLFLNRCAAST